MDRRRHTRVDFACSLFLATSAGERWDAKIQNVSMAGVYVGTDRLLDMGERCRVEFDVDSGYLIDFDGQVVRRDEAGKTLGIRIVRIDVKSQLNLYRLVTQKFGDATRIDGEIIDAQLFDDDFYVGQR